MSLPFTDSFTGSAGVLANPPYTQVALSGTTLNLDGSGNAKASAADAAGDIIAYDNSNTYSNDQYAQVVISGGVFSGIQWAEVFVRCTGTGGTFKAYQFYTDGNNGANHTELSVYSGGVATVLRNFSPSPAFATGDTMRIEVSGTTITCYKNGVSIGTQTDSVATSGAAGIGVFNNSSNAVTLDNFESGNLGSPPPTIPLEADNDSWIPSIELPEYTTLLY